MKTGKVPVSSPAKWPLMLEAGWLTLWTTVCRHTFPCTSTPSRPILDLSLSPLELFHVSLLLFFFVLAVFHRLILFCFAAFTFLVHLCAFVIIFSTCKCVSKGSVLCQSLQETEKFDTNVRGLCNGFSWGLKDVCTRGDGMGGSNLFRTFVWWI